MDANGSRLANRVLDVSDDRDDFDDLLDAIAPLDDEACAGSRAVARDMSRGLDEEPQVSDIDLRDMSRAGARDRAQEVAHELASDPALDLPPAHVPGYTRDRLGRWRYTADGTCVPGARDANLETRYRWRPRRGFVWVPTADVRRDDALAWCERYPVDVDEHGTACHPVPADDWDARRRIPIGMVAPELMPDVLLDVAALARYCGVATSTISTYLTRGYLTEPVARLAGTPVWSRPVIDRWLAARPGRGAKLRR